MLAQFQWKRVAIDLVWLRRLHGCGMSKSDTNGTVDFMKETIEKQLTRMRCL